MYSWFGTVHGVKYAAEQFKDHTMKVQSSITFYYFFIFLFLSLATSFTTALDLHSHADGAFLHSK